MKKRISSIASIFSLALLLSLSIQGVGADRDALGLMPGDSDGDGVPDSTDLCPFEDASYFDRDGDGCLDEVLSARHIEYWAVDQMPFTYYIHEEGAPGIGDGSDFGAILASMSVWGAIPGTDFAVTYGGSTTQGVADALDRVNLVTFDDDEFLFPSAVLAVGISTSFTVDSLFEGTWYRPGQLVDSDMIFNPAKSFVTPSSGGTGTDIQSVATHEAAHLFGISHIPVWTSTMFFVLGPGQASASLETEDELMFLRAYPDAATLASASRLTGTVTGGGTGLPVPGAIVFAIEETSGDTLASDFTLPDGSYTFIGLPDGDYYVAIYPLDGTAPIGYMQPGHVNWLVGSTAETNFVPEYYNVGDSFDEDPSAKDAVAVAAGSQVTIDLVTNIDVTPPAVAAVLPADGAIEVGVDATLLVSFSEAVNTATIAGNFRLENTGTGSAVGGNAGILKDDSLIAFTPWEPLDYAAVYQLTIDTGLEDKFGNALEFPFTSGFTTEDQPPLFLEAITPAMGVEGSVITLTGTGFDPDPAANTVRFVDVLTSVTYASPTQLVVTVPVGAVTGEVTVENALGTSGGIVFTILPETEIARMYSAGKVEVSSIPRSIAITPDGGYVYVATGAGAAAVVADPGAPDYLSATSIAVAGGLSDIAVTPDGARAYGVCRVEGELHVVDSDPADGALFNTLIATVPVGDYPLGIVIGPAGRRAYVPTQSGDIQIWDIARSSPSVNMPIGAIESPDPNLKGKMAIDPTGRMLLALTGTGRLLVFDLEADALLANIDIGPQPRDVAVDPAGQRAYVTDETGIVTVVSLSSLLAVQDIEVGGALRGLALTPAGTILYSANRQNNLLNVIDLMQGSPTFRSVVASVPQDVNPVDVCVSPNGLYAYSISEEDRTVMVTGIGLGPAFKSLSKRAGPHGAKLVLAGEDLGDSCSVSFSGPGGTIVTAYPERSRETALSFSVPDGAVSGPLSVLDAEGRMSNARYFEVLGPTPSPGHLQAGHEAEPEPALDLMPVICMSPIGDQAAMGSHTGELILWDTDRSSPTYNQQLEVIPLGTKRVTEIAITPDGTRAIVSLEKLGFAADFFIVDVNRYGDSYGEVLDQVQFNGFPSTVTEEVNLGTTGESCIFYKELTISPDGALCLIQDACSDIIYFVDILEGSPTENAVVDTVDVPKVTEIAFHPAGACAYLVSAFLFEIHILDMDPDSPTYGEIVNMIELPSPHGEPAVGCRPLSCSFLPDGDQCLVLGKDLTNTQPYLHTLDTSDPRNPVILGSDVIGSNFPFSGQKRVVVSPRGDRAVFQINTIGMFNVDISQNPYVVLDFLAGPLYESELDFQFTPDGSDVYLLSGDVDSLVLSGFGAAATLSMDSGDGQTGVAGEVLAAPLRVKAIDGNSDPASGIAVTFVVTGGGGSFVSTGTDLRTVSTDAAGYASVSWQLGPDIGAQQVEASAVGLAGSPILFGAEAIQDPDELPLMISTLTPVDGADEVSVTTAVKAVFSRAIEVSSVSETTIFLHVLGDPTPLPVTYGFTNGNKEISLTPVANLSDGADYVIEVTDGLLDETMTPVVNPTVTNFSTAATVPLALSSVNPPSATRYVVIVLAGTGFDPVLANNRVFFNDVEVTPKAGGIDYLEVKVPGDAESGTIRVVRDSETTNTKPFTVLEPETSPIDEVITTIGTGYATQAIAVTPDGSMIYSLSPESDVVVPTDIAEFVSYDGIAVGDHPISIRIHPAGERAYVANFGSGNVFVIDIDPDSPDYHEVITDLSVGANPIDLAVSPDGDRLYVANIGSSSISVIDADEDSETYNQVLATIGTGSTTNCVSIKPDGSLLYVGTEDGYLVIDPVNYAVLARIGTGSATQSITIKPDGVLMFLLTTEGEVLIVDIEPGSETENFVVARVSGGSTVKSIAMKPDGLLLYLIQEESDIILVVLVEVMDAMSVIDPDIDFPPKTVEVSIIDSLYAGEDPAYLVFDPTGTGVAYITNTGPQTVTVVNTSEIPEISVALAIPAGKTVYVCNSFKYVELEGWTITNLSPMIPVIFDYELSTEGPAYFAEGEDPSPYMGTTPLLSPGESYYVPGAGLWVDGNLVMQMGGAVQTVLFDITCPSYPDFQFSTGSDLTFLPYTIDVLISDFELIPLEGAVRIIWDISADEVIEGFNIYRTGDGEELLLNGPDLIAAESREFMDKDVEGGVEYVYTLGVVTSDGIEMKSMTESVQARAIPLALRQNYPNPFNPVTTISFTLPKRAHVNLAVYNVEGKLMRVLVDEMLDSGLKEIPWDGKDSKGIEASSGVYFYRLEADKRVLTRKMVLLR